MKALGTWHHLATGLLGSALLLGVVGCELDSSRHLQDSPDGVSDTSPTDDAELGSLSFDLTTSSGLSFDKFQYVIVRGTFNKAGSIDVKQSTHISALIDELPAGTGYSIALTGKSLAPDKADCAGAKSFDILPGKVTSVDVNVACHLPEAVVGNPPTAPAPAPVPPLFAGLLGISLLVLGARKRP